MVKGQELNLWGMGGWVWISHGRSFLSDVIQCSEYSEHTVYSDRVPSEECSEISAVLKCYNQTLRCLTVFLIFKCLSSPRFESCLGTLIGGKIGYELK